MLAFQKNKTRSFFALLSLPATAMGFALSTQIAALSWILTTQYHLEIEEVGLVWAAGPLAGILGQVIIGLISDKAWFWNGRRRPFILIGGTIAALMLLALPNIGVISSSLGIEAILGVAIAVALSLDLAINISFNPTRSIIADVTDEGVERTRGYAWMQTVSGTFGVLAYAVGAIFNNYILIYLAVVLVLLFSVLPPFFIEEPREHELVPQSGPAIREQGSLRHILMSIRPLWGFLVYDVYAMSLRLAGVAVEHYYAEIALLVVTAVLFVITFREQETGTDAASKDAGFRKVLAAHSFSWVGVFITLVFLVPYIRSALPELNDIDLGRVGSMSYLVFNAVSAVLPVLVLAPLAVRFGRIAVHAGCLWIMTIGYVGLYFFGVSAISIYLLMAVIGVGWAAIVSLPFAIVSQKILKEKMGLYMGLFNLSVVLPQLVVSAGISLIVSRAPDKSIIFAISALAMAASAFTWHFVKEDAD